MNGNFLAINKKPFNEAPADLKNAQIPPVFAIHQVTETILDGASAGGNEPNVQESHHESQA